VEFCDLEFLIMKKNGVLWEVRQLPFFFVSFFSPLGSEIYVDTYMKELGLRNGYL
jgi:hypothetical protein